MNYYTRDAKIFDGRGNCVGIFKTEYEATQMRDNLQKRLDEVLDQCGTFTYHVTYRFSEGFKRQYTQRVTIDGACKLFNWLVERKLKSEEE